MCGDPGVRFGDRKRKEFLLMVSFWFSLKSEMPPYLKWGRDAPPGRRGHGGTCQGLVGKQGLQGLAQTLQALSPSPWTCGWANGPRWSPRRSPRL